MVLLEGGRDPSGTKVKQCIMLMTLHQKVIAAFDGWNAEVSQWKSELDRFELPGHAKMLLTSFGLFARVYINQGGLEDPVLIDNPRRWVYGTAAAQAAHDMLEIAQLEPFCSGLALFPPIYIQVCSLYDFVFYIHHE